MLERLLKKLIREIFQATGIGGLCALEETMKP